MSLREQQAEALAEFDTVLETLASADRRMRELALDLRATGVPREVLAKKMVANLGVPMTTARARLKVLEARGADSGEAG